MFDSKSIFIYHEGNKIELDENAYVKLISKKGNLFAEIYSGKSLILRFQYYKTGENFDNDVSSFVEEEDFDWGLFLRNILNNPIRKKNIFDNINNVKSKSN